MLKITESINNRTKLSMDNLSIPVVKSCIHVDNGIDIDIEVKNNTIYILNKTHKHGDLRIDVDKWEEIGLPKEISFEGGRMNVIFSNNIIDWTISGNQVTTLFLLRTQKAKQCTFIGKDMKIFITDGTDYWEPTEEPIFLYEGDFDDLSLESTGKMIDEIFSNNIKSGSIIFRVSIYVDEDFMEDNDIEDVIDLFEQEIIKYSKLYHKYSKYVDIDVSY